MTIVEFIWLHSVEVLAKILGSSRNSFSIFQLTSITFQRSTSKRATLDWFFQSNKDASFGAHLGLRQRKHTWFLLCEFTELLFAHFFFHSSSTRNRHCLVYCSFEQHFRVILRYFVKRLRSSQRSTSAQSRLQLCSLISVAAPARAPAHWICELVSSFFVSSFTLTDHGTTAAVEAPPLWTVTAATEANRTCHMPPAPQQKLRMG